jgi:hypothetical protein
LNNQINADTERPQNLLLWSFGFKSVWFNSKCFNSE